jgi:hypothetical protein
MEHWGELMKMARRAATLATEEMRKRGVISDPLDSSILLYTDDPTTAALFSTQNDMATICKTSAIEGICIADAFPPASHEAERMDMEFPRVAAMYFRAPGSKCPRCRNYTVAPEDEICGRCERLAEG